VFSRKHSNGELGGPKSSQKKNKAMVGLETRHQMKHRKLQDMQSLL